MIKEKLLFIVFVFIFAYLSNFKEMNMRDTSILKKINKPLMQTDYWEFYASELGKKYIFCHWECLLLPVVTI